MKQILLNCNQGGYWLIEVPNHIAENAFEYKLKFINWVNDESNDHGYWHEEPHFGGPALRYDPQDAFTKWLNEYELKDSEEKATIVPLLYF